MKAGDVVLVRLPQLGGGAVKLRPALLLADLPGPYQNLLVCGISTQLHDQVLNWDELIQPADADFATSGLHRASIARLSYLCGVDHHDVVGVIGRIDSQRLDRLLTRLSDHLRP